MTVNGNHTTYQNGDDRGMVQMALFYPHSSFRNDKPTLGLPKPWRDLERLSIGIGVLRVPLATLAVRFFLRQGSIISV
jgi:hypothetical protein